MIDKVKSDVLPIPVYILADDTPQQLVERLIRVRDLFYQSEAEKSSFREFLHHVRKSKEGSGKEDEWVVMLENNHLEGAFLPGALRLYFTTNENRVLELVKEHAPAVISLDVQWRDQANRGLEIANQLLEDEDLIDKFVILLKSTVRGEDAADFLRKSRKMLPLRNPFFGEIGRYNFQVVETTHDEYAGGAFKSLELERVQYALLALMESLLFQRSNRHVSYAQFARDLSVFADQANFFGCFSGEARKSYKSHLQQTYGFSRALIVPHKSYRDQDCKTGIDFTFVNTVSGIVKDFNTQGYSLSKRFKRQLHWMAGEGNIAERSVIVRLLLRYDRVHPVESLLYLLPLNGSGKVGTITKSIVQQKWNVSKFEQFGEDSAFVPSSKIKSSLNGIVKIVGSYSRERATHLIDKTTKFSSFLIGGQNGALDLDFDDLEMGLSEIRESLSRYFSLVESDHISGEINRLEKLITPRDGLLFFERPFGNSKLNKIPFAEKIVSLLRWKQVQHPFVFARKCAEQYLRKQDVELLVDALCLDCDCSIALSELARMPSDKFEEFCVKATQVNLDTKLPANSVWEDEESLKIPLLNQIAFCLFFQEWRISSFLRVLNAAKQEKNSGSIKLDEMERICKILSELWKERGWTELYSPEIEGNWEFVPMENEWGKVTSISCAFRKMLPQVWECFLSVRSKIENTEKAPAWAVSGWTPPADFEWMHELELFGRMKGTIPLGMEKRSELDGDRSPEATLSTPADQIVELEFSDDAKTAIGEELLDMTAIDVLEVLTEALGDRIPGSILDRLVEGISSCANDMSYTKELLKVLDYFDEKYGGIIEELAKVITVN